jgi:hypothetical protein
MPTETRSLHEQGDGVTAVVVEHDRLLCSSKSYIVLGGPRNTAIYVPFMG